MTYRAFFDTNVLAYEFDRSDPRKRTLAEKLLDEWRPLGRLIISTQILQELYVVLTRKMGIEAEDAEGIIRRYARLEVIIIDPELIFEGIRISRKYKISFWDALVVGAAKKGVCKVLFTEDLSHGSKIEGLEIVNPFSQFI